MNRWSMFVALPFLQRCNAEGLAKVAQDYLFEISTWINQTHPMPL